MVASNNFYALMIIIELESPLGKVYVTGEHHNQVYPEDKDFREVYSQMPNWIGEGEKGRYICCLSPLQMKFENFKFFFDKQIGSYFGHVHFYICEIAKGMDFYVENDFIYTEYIKFEGEIRSMEELKDFKSVAAPRMERAMMSNKSESKVISLDFETVLYDQEQRACQIGITPIIDGKLLETSTYFVKPPHNQYDYYSQKIHHITKDMTANAPNFDEIWKVIKTFFVDADAVVCHNQNTEKSVLKNEFTDYGLDEMKFNFVDTLKLYRDKYNDGTPYPYSFTLEHLCEAYGLSTDNHHDAGADSRMCAEIYMKYNNGIEPDWTIMDKYKSAKKMNAGTFSKKEELSLSDFIDVDSISVDKDSYLYGKTIVVTHAFTIFGKEVGKSEELIKDYLRRKYNAKTTSSISGKTDYVFFGKIEKNEDLSKGKYQKIQEMKKNPACKLKVLHQEDVDKMLEAEKKIW